MIGKQLMILIVYQNNGSPMYADNRRKFDCPASARHIVGNKLPEFGVKVRRACSGMLFHIILYMMGSGSSSVYCKDENAGA